MTTTRIDRRKRSVMATPSGCPARLGGITRVNGVSICDRDGLVSDSGKEGEIVFRAVSLFSGRSLM